MLPPTKSPLDPNFENRIRESFARQSAMQTLGIRMERVAPGEVDLAMPHSKTFTQQHGFMHAGAITTALDTACGYAALSVMPVSADVLTIEFKTNLLAPARAVSYAVRARVVKAGRTIVVCEGQAFGVDEAGETLVATMSATMMTLLPRV
jgi:uncharacterized protein (TIGR00369 family)